MRQTGIDSIGPVPWGTHFCQFYQDQQDLVDILIPYFKAGLENNEACLWITSDPLRLEAAQAALAERVGDLDRYLRSGQIEILDYKQWYTPDGEFECDRVLRAWIEKLRAAEEKGFDGLRLSGNTFWLEKRSWRDFTEYEAAVDNVIGECPMLAICTYCLSRCGAAEVVDVLSNHAFALVKRTGNWQVLASAERKRMAASLHQSEERYRLLVEMSPDAILVNRNNAIVQANAAAIRLLGAEGPHQVVGKTPFEIFHPDFHAAIRQRIDALLAGRSVPLIEEKVVRVDGTTCDVEVAASPFPESTGLAMQVILRDISERKRAEEDLRRQREWLRVTLASIGDAVLVTDREGRITFLNAVAAGLTGWDQQEALGRPAAEVFRIVNERTNAPGENIVEEVLREERSASLANHTALVARDGREIPIEDSAAPIRDADGKVAGVVLVFHDVAAKRRAEEALRSESERLRQLNRTLKAHIRSDQALLLAGDEKSYLEEVCKIIVEDCGYAMVWVGFCQDDEARRVLPVAYSGFEEGYLESLQISWADTERGRGPTGTAIRTGQATVCADMHGDPSILPWREQALRRGYRSSIALPLMAGGSAFGALTIYSTVPNHFVDEEVRLLSTLAGDFAFAIQTLRIKDAHARSEQALRESEERFRTLAETIPHSVWVSAPDGSPLFVNRRLLQYRRLADAELAAWRVWKDGVHPEDLGRCEQMWGTLVQTGEDVAFEFRLLRACDGVYRWQLAHGSAVRDESGAVTRLIGTTTDIHDQKLAEEAVRQAQKLESIGLLAGGIAHDFNNLLVGVIGNASLAGEMLPAGSPALEMLQHIIESGERAANLTRQMLAYAGKGQFVMEAVDLSGVVRKSLGLLQSSISKRIQLQLQLDPGIARIQSDPSQIQQVLMNLVLNAAEAIGGSGSILIRTGETALDAAYLRNDLEGWEAEPGTFVFLEVADTGCGMDEATKSRVFDPFFTTKFQGRGLGLAAVAGIVRAHKGAIRLTTAPGTGTTFRILFPAETPSTLANSRSGGKREQSAPRKRTVLVVDDEQVVRDVAKSSLERQGYEVLVADSGPAAIDVVRCEGGRIDLVILDLSMPGMNGEEALPRLRDLKPGLNVIVSSGYNEQDALRLFQGAVVSGFLQKPYTVQELTRQATALLR